MADKHIRLDSQLSSVAAFWKPESPDDIMTGNLTVDDEGIHFVTSPKYARGSEVGRPSLDHISFIPGPALTVLHGFFDEGNCTLLQLMDFSHPGLVSYKEEPQSILSTAHRAGALITGLHTGDLNCKCIDSARYTFTSLAEWLRPPLGHEWGEKYITITVPLEETEILDFCTASSRIRIQLRIRHEFIWEESRLVVARPVAFVEVTPAEPEALSWFLGVGNRLENLFSLLTGTSLGMETLFIYQGEQSGTVIRKQHEYVRECKFFDSVRYTHSQLSHATATWMSEADGFREIENLLLGVLRKGKLFIETEFLSLAQAIEGFHRATQARSAASSAEKTSFLSRLMELCGRINEQTLTNMGIAPQEFGGEVVRMRNFFTHAGNLHSTIRKPLEGKELFLLSQKMRALLRGVFLLHLGFPEGQISELIIREATKIQIVR